MNKSGISDEVAARLEHGSHFLNEEELRTFLEEVGFPHHVVWVPADHGKGVLIWGTARTADEVVQMEAEATEHFRPHRIMKE